MGTAIAYRRLGKHGRGLHCGNQRKGGHVGLVQRRFPGIVHNMPVSVAGWPGIPFKVIRQSLPLHNRGMDDIVKQAIAKWPHVPHCYGWLGLDARGRWYMRDDGVQAAGPFAQSRGDWLQHDKLVEFIQRNYEADAKGQWYFQNGPQRVYVELECTPIIWHIQTDFSLVSHTGRSAKAQECMVDEQGRVYLVCTQGLLGLVHTLDVSIVAQAIDQRVWTLRQVNAEDLSSLYGYVISPQSLREQETKASAL